MHKFDIGDIVAVKYDIAGMIKGEIGIVSDKLFEHGMIEIMCGGLKYYNMFPESLEHVMV